MSADQILTNFVAQHTHADPAHIQITKLFGQASTRQYFRATLERAHACPPTCPPKPQRRRKLEERRRELTSARTHDDILDFNTYVIMLLPQGFSSPAEEITKTGKDAPQELPFINIQKYLASLEINVPKIYALDTEKGLLLLEDLGDTLFEDLVKKSEGEFFLMYYRKAIDLLVDLQTRTLTNSPNPLLLRGGLPIASHRSFDADLLNWEWDHFLEYGIEDRLGIKVSDADRQTYKESTRKLTDLITKMPQGFVMRDFQSRNIIFHNFDFYLIDFQDALTGPVLYDLVALLRDSYVAINPKHVESLLDYYASILPKEHPYYHMTDQSDPTDPSDLLLRDFHILTLQRKLKDAGRFQYIHTVKKNPNFLIHVSQSLEYARCAFDKLEEMGWGQMELQKIIGKYLNEFS